MMLYQHALALCSNTLALFISSVLVEYKLEKGVTNGTEWEGRGRWERAEGGGNTQLNQAEDVRTEVTGNHTIFKLSIQKG